MALTEKVTFEPDTADRLCGWMVMTGIAWPKTEDEQQANARHNRDIRSKQRVVTSPEGQNQQPPSWADCEIRIPGLFGLFNIFQVKTAGSLSNGEPVDSELPQAF